MNVIAGINTFLFFVSSKLLSPQRRKLIKLLLLAVKKMKWQYFPSFTSCGFVSIRKIVMGEMVCWGVSFNTTGTRFI